MFNHAHAAVRPHYAVGLSALSILSSLGCSGIVDYPTPPSSGGAPSNSGGASAEISMPPSAQAGQPAVADSGCEALEAQVSAMLKTNCAGCHAAPAREANFDYVLDPLKLQASGLIVPKRSADSPLVKLVVSGVMPPTGKQPRPSSSDISALTQWVDGCLGSPPMTPVPGAMCVPSRMTKDTMLAEMVRDVQALNVLDRPFTRYFTLGHLANQGVCGAELDTYRFALAKAANALSLGAQLVPPTAIDQDELIYRVDLRDYRWDRSDEGEDQWERMVRANPYAFELLDDQADILKLFTGTEVPFQSADWFVNAATQPPLYHDLLDIPATVPGLEAQLGVSISGNIFRGEVWRAGFLTSGVSHANRIIERHEIPASASRSLWVSYDFALDGGRENIFTNPLDFQADGSEMIFTLPNGLHGYMIANAAGTRLDEAPDVIVVDPNQENRNVRNGISCMSCHEGGIKPKQDQVRDFVLQSLDFAEDEKERVAELYPIAEELAALIERDASQFQAAVRTVTSGGPVDAEPIITVFHAFDEDVTLERAAAELGVEPQTLLIALGRLDPSLAALATGSVKREVFEAAFAAAVCELNLGLARSPSCSFQAPDSDSDF